MCKNIASINVLNYNTFEKTRRCIDSCLAQREVDFEVLLIDNHSSDGSLEELKKLFKGQILVLENEDNFGYAKGNNLGVKYSFNRGNQYSMILNSDIELHGNLVLKRLLNIIESQPRCSVVAPFNYNVTANGLVLNQNNSSYLQWLRFAGILPKCNIISDMLTEISEAQGSALLVDNEEFLNLEGFPEHYFMYGEEGCFAKKVLWNNRQILWYEDHNNYALHFHDKIGKIDDWRLYLMGRNRTLEYLEYRRRKPILWRIVFHLFTFRMRMSGNNVSYLRGVSMAMQMYKLKATVSDYFVDGQDARKIMRVDT